VRGMVDLGDQRDSRARRCRGAVLFSVFFDLSV
jgi:hypothetical protein